MAGHSKWANIKHRKGAQDAKRGKIFTRLIREITTAARLGDPDPNMNPRLRLAIDKAKAESMPKDNIERAIKRGAGELDGADFEEVRYEGYGPGGAAVMVECMTDNRNRTVADVRHAFSKFGGNLGSDGSVAFLFKHCGVLSYPAGADDNAILEAALEAGADDVVVNDDGSVDVITEPAEFEGVKEKMQAASHGAGIRRGHDVAHDQRRSGGRSGRLDAQDAGSAGGSGRRAERLHQRRYGPGPAGARRLAPDGDTAHHPRYRSWLAGHGIRRGDP